MFAANDNTTTKFLDLYCYACGLPEINPEVDAPGSFGDSRLEWTPSNKKVRIMSRIIFYYQKISSKNLPQVDNSSNYFLVLLWIAELSTNYLNYLLKVSF